jgi:hypothetical protein
MRIRREQNSRALNLGKQTCKQQLMNQTENLSKKKM